MVYLSYSLIFCLISFTICQAELCVLPHVQGTSNVNVLCTDRRVFRAAADAERGPGVVIAVCRHRGLLLRGRRGRCGGRLQAMKPTPSDPQCFKQ